MGVGPFFDKKLNTNASALITSGTTTTIFEVTGVLMGFTIGAPVADSTFYCTDIDDASIDGLPTAAAPWISSSAGGFDIPEYTLLNGLKVTTTDATGISFSVWAYTP